MLEAVVNISEGRSSSVLDALRAVCIDSLLDVHSDSDHNRSVFTLARTDVAYSVDALTRKAVELLDLRSHSGIHPRIGVVDVVPFVALPGLGSTHEDAVTARNDYAKQTSASLDVPCFLYGTERSLPDVRRSAFRSLCPDFGPPGPHKTAGAIAVGARPMMVAYNLWLESNDVVLARRIAGVIRNEYVRALGLSTDNQVQVSCNLIAPLTAGPDVVYDAVAQQATIARAELVGLVTKDVVANIDRRRHKQLDLSKERTVEARL